MTKKEFQAKIKYAVDQAIIKATQSKTDNERYLTYIDAINITSFIRRIFIVELGIVPTEIDNACDLSNAILAPSRVERERLIKNAKATSVGVTGFALIIASIASALGWGIGVQAAIVAWFVGSSILGPLGLAVAGISVSVIAGYFFISGSEAERAERYEKALKGSLKKAIDNIWKDFGNKLSVIPENGSNR